jgi:tetratricopeptide (TPR) repeat protein
VKKQLTILLFITLGASLTGKSQSTVFGLFRNSQKIADKNYGDENYAEAIEVYKKVLIKNPEDQNTRIKLAQSYFFVKDFKAAVSTYNKFLENKGDALPWKDFYRYAEAQATLGDYRAAVDNYKKCLEHEPNNEIVAKKIWRLNNIQYLYEDSSHFSIWPININTNNGELCAVQYKDGIVYTSNKKSSSAFESVNGKLNSPFYKLYNAKWQTDTTGRNAPIFLESKSFGRSLKAKYNTGPVAFYKNYTRMVFITTSQKTGDTGNRNLGIYFAILEGNKWKQVSAYPHNSDQYSIGDVTISEDGETMYFSSDMKGGFGGKDIYVSKMVNNQWSRPKNVGDEVNTSEQEVFPYLHANGTFLFSSDGHAGMGGLDIFKAQVSTDGISEPQNIGYPINSGYDDFGVTLDSLGTHGYLSSNRRNGAYDDDIYEFDMDLQTYPFTIAGVIKFKEHTWSDESAIHIWPNVKIILMDSWKNSKVEEVSSDKSGNFSVSIPYFSKYYIQIIDEAGEEHKASLEILKYKTETSAHEIVVVKDIFKQNADQK